MGPTTSHERHSFAFEMEFETCGDARAPLLRVCASARAVGGQWLGGRANGLVRGREGPHIVRRGWLLCVRRAGLAATGRSRQRPREMAPPRFTALYELLGVPPDASASAIKKAYHKLAVATHPDRCADADATERFQKLQAVYEVLRDAERRALYDETGATGEDDAGIPGANCADFDELKAFWKSMHEEVTEEKIAEFAASYRGSEEEEADLLANYERFGGDMRRVYEVSMCSEEGEDDGRLKDFFDAKIGAGDIKATAAYKKWAKKVASAKPRRRKGAKAKQQEQASMSALIAQISGRSAARAAGGSWADRFGVNMDDDPLASDDAFLAAQARLGVSRGGVEKPRKGKGRAKAR